MLVTPPNVAPDIIKRFASILLLGAFMLASAGFYASNVLHHSANAGSSAVVLPLEVIGADGYTVSATFNVGDPSGIDRLSMQLHNLSYDGEGYVRLNGGSWTRLADNTLTCAYPESAFDCVGGAYKTIRVTMPISGVQAGQNTLEFRLDYRDGSLSAGYRVLRFNLLRSGGAEALPAATFAYDDPTAWVPPRNNAADIDAGEALWHRENHLVDLPGSNTVLRASCSDCHAQGGEDLKYFNFSNHSIVERSKFHGLSQREGEQIASYIRALDGPNPGTPWDPPYQPGPGLDDRPAEEWAAGAGLEAVLDRDEDMLSSLFPDGIATEAVSTEETMNVREMPVAIQFPDWNEWLPRVHPKDAWGNVFTSHQVYKNYDRDFPNVLAQGVEQAVSSGDIVDLMEEWANEFREFKKDTNKEYYFGGYDNEGIVADYMLGLFQWQAVKTWEIMTTNPGLEEAAPEIYPGVGEPRSWFGKARAVFDVAPHINGPDQSEPFPHGSEIQNRYFSTAWYQLQMTLNAGNRNGLNIRPQDWKYHLEHIRGNGKYTDIREPLRFYQSYAKMMQMADNHRGVGSPSGWHLRHVSPAWLLANRPGGSKDVFREIDPNLRREITEVLLDAFMDKMERHDLSEWPREHGLEGIEPASFQPTPWSGSGLVFDNTTYANHFYRMIPRFDEMGVDPAILHRIATWSEAAWPLGDWDSLYDYDGPDPDPDPPGGDPPEGLVITAPSEGATFAEGADVTIAVDFDDNGSVFQKVKFFANDRRMKTLRNQQMPTSYTVTDAEPGTYELRVVAIDGSGESFETDPITVTVTEGGATVITEEIPLNQGWNDVTLSVQPLDDYVGSVVESVSADLKRVEDDQGRVYDPRYGIEEFTTWEADRAYRVKVGRATTLAVEGTPLNAGRGMSADATTDALGGFRLEQNYPNPFNPTTVIEYTLPDEALVSLRVYNALGQHVATLVEETQPAGNHQATFDAVDLPSGVYVYKLRASGSVAARQMMFLR